MQPRRFSINEAIAFGWDARIRLLGFLTVALAIILSSTGYPD
jgi:hypothetical protein